MKAVNHRHIVTYGHSYKHDTLLIMLMLERVLTLDLVGISKLVKKSKKEFIHGMDYIMD